MTKEKKTDNAENNENNIRKKIFSDKKIVYIDIDDEITSVYDRIKNLKVKNIYIVAPERACLFNSIVNLKILKKKMEELDKTLFLITNDKVGVNLALQSEIVVYEKNQNEVYLQDAIPTAQVKISPISATKNFLEEDKPKRMEHSKFSIFDIIKRKNTKETSTTEIFKIKLKAKSNKKNLSKENKLQFFKGYKSALGGLILVSLVLFFIVSYIALPGATIYLKPKSNVIEQNVNIILADYKRNEAELGTHPINMIPAYPIIPEGPIKKTFKYNSTGQIFKGENARGEIIIINESPNPWTLVEKTRFQSPEGIIFRITNKIVVPKGTKNGPGALKVLVIADEKDANGVIVGDKGNIGPSQFFLPGLRESNQKIIYAKNENPMAGGKTEVTKIISKEDIEGAKQYAKNEIINEIKPALEEHIKNLNNIKKTNLALLTEQKIEWKRAIKYNDPKIFIDESLAGKQVDSFEISAEITASGIAYNLDEFSNILKRELKHRQLPEKRLTKIDDGSITYRLFENEPISNKYKVTATIKGIEEYEIDPEQENGAKLIKKIKERIIGMNKEKASKFIQNLEEIDRVEIRSRPSWAPTLPSIESNIKVSILKE